MTDVELVKRRIGESIAVKQKILGNELIISKITSFAVCIVESIKMGGKIVLCGNGGSASDALHFAGEIVGRFARERHAWPAVVLNADVATMTAIANDYGYEEVFARQVEGHVKKGDVFIGISTSGNSENIYRAQLKAKELGAITACLAGKDGGKIAQTADYSIVIPSNITARIQESHITIIHVLCELVELLLTSPERKDE